MIYEMKLKDIYFNKIQNGSKIYEIRLNDEKRQMLCIGDTIIFKSESDLKNTVTTSIDNLIYFKNFEDMAKTLSNDEIGFENTNINDIVDTYHQFYNVDDELKYGVVAIKLRLK